MKQNVIQADGKKAVIYLRVSTEEQVDNFSLDTQEEICRKEAERRGYEVIDVFREEGRSAKSISGRPVLIGLLEYARRHKKKFQAVFVYRIDRVSRQTADFLIIQMKLADVGISIISATEPIGDTPTERFVGTMLASVAQLDNDIRAERARNGMRARFMSGLIVSGRAPLGYVIRDGIAIKDLETWDKMKQAWELMATGTKSLQEITNVMNEWGLRENHRGKYYLIRRNRAQVLFRNKFYMGVLASKTYKQEIQGQHEPMVSEQVFYRVQAILDGRNPNKSGLARRNSASIEFPLRRVIRCGRCGIGLTAGWSKGRHKKYPYYRCGSFCTTTSIKEDTLENTLIGTLKQYTPKPEILNLFIDFILASYNRRMIRLQKLQKEADREIENIKATRKVLVEKNLSGIYSDEVFQEQSKVLEDRLVKAQIAKDDATIDKYDIQKLTTFIKTVLADLGETYKSKREDPSQLKVLLGSMFPDGLSWSYNDTLNHKISPLYQAIRDFDPKAVSSCGLDRI